MGAADAKPLFTIAHDGNRRWAKPSPEIRPSVWGNWKDEVYRVMAHPEMDWAETSRPEGEQSGQMKLRPCKHCKREAGTTLTRLTTWSSGKMSKGRDDHRAEPCVGAGEDPRNGARRTPAELGMQSGLPLTSSRIGERPAPITESDSEELENQQFRDLSPDSKRIGGQAW